jgi:hypothetical protein
MDDGPANAARASSDDGGFTHNSSVRLIDCISNNRVW